MATVYLGLGSNLGNCRHYLASAIDHLQTFVNVVACSEILRTKPMYIADQPDFYNQVIKIETEIPALTLLSLLKNLEIQMGRVPSYRYGPRVIDVDIIYYGRLIFKNSVLEVPHPRNDEREFILRLMAELAPDFSCPITRTTMQEKLFLLRLNAAA